MDQSDTSLGRALRRLSEAEALVIEQAAHIDDLKMRGQDTKDAEEVLQLLQKAVEFMREDVARARLH